MVTHDIVTQVYWDIIVAMKVPFVPLLFSCINIIVIFSVLLGTVTWAASVNKALKER